jgi:hypothetical protein
MELPKPEVVRCFFEQSFDTPLAAMELRWDPDGHGVAERAWHLPDSVMLKGPAPERFGIMIHRHGADSYQVRVAWNRLCLSWDGLSRVQIMTSSLAIVLAALGTDLWYLLSQPVEEEEPTIKKVA